MTGSTGAQAVVVRIKLEKRDGVADRQAVGNNACRAAQGCAFLESAPISKALVADGRVSICQDAA
jgi:hypothetical protein